MRALLTGDERERAGRFHFQRDSSAFAISRGLLRTLAGRYLDAPPERLRFDYTPYGKPYLAGQFAGSPLRFNLSHAHELVLYAFTSGAEVGVDVEYLRPELAGAEIAERFFSPREVEALLTLPVEGRTEAFFRCWTRKEAFIKAVGQGLSFPLDQFRRFPRAARARGAAEREGRRARGGALVDARRVARVGLRRRPRV